MFNSQFDFETVENILLCPPIPCPHKLGFQYVNVLLFVKGKDKLMPILFPYLYKTRLRKKGGKNDLKKWLLVNNKCEEVMHEIKNFT